jgi:eukaryotic-like serine/threonine-protein kinase
MSVDATEPGPASVPREPREGERLGRYLLVRRIGEGGMGVVFEAIDSNLGRRVAIKTLHARHVRSGEVQQRFLREGQAASRVHHANVAAVFDVGGGSHPYLVMEYLAGEDLSCLLEREGRLSVERAADLLVPVVAALATAHDLGVVHRDLKPANIFLANERNRVTPKVLDFGISRITDRADAASITDTGALIGTPCYVSPEQARGDRHLDARSDQYSLGVILYQAATGRRPVDEPSVYAVLQRIVAGDFPTPRTVCPSLLSAIEKVIVRAMARDPDGRFPSTRAFGCALLPFASAATRAAYESELRNEVEPRANATADTELLRLNNVAPRDSRELRTTLGDSVQLLGLARRGAAMNRLWLLAVPLLPIISWFAWRAGTTHAEGSGGSTGAHPAAAGPLAPKKLALDLARSVVASEPELPSGKVGEGPANDESPEATPLPKPTQKPEPKRRTPPQSQAKSVTPDHSAGLAPAVNPYAEQK